MTAEQRGFFRRESFGKKAASTNSRKGEG